MLYVLVPQCRVPILPGDIAGFLFPILPGNAGFLLSGLGLGRCVDFTAGVAAVPELQYKADCSHAVSATQKTCSSVFSSPLGNTDSVDY